MTPRDESVFDEIRRLRTEIAEQREDADDKRNEACDLEEEASRLDRQADRSEKRVKELAKEHNVRLDLIESDLEVGQIAWTIEHVRRTIAEIADPVKLTEDMLNGHREIPDPPRWRCLEDDQWHDRAEITEITAVRSAVLA